MGPVLLTGARGSGKNIAARDLHLWSDRHTRTFLPVLVSSLCEDLLTDELFGHTQHSFTGALSRRAGKLAMADTGTVFLDEIGDLSAAAQAALLRVLETGEFTPIGADQPQILDVRIIAASNQSLPRLIAEGRFRADLYDRLSVFEIRVPPLRERRDDIPALASYFLNECCRMRECHFERTEPKACASAPRAACASEEFYRGLRACDWPGNVRELRSHIIRLRAGHPMPHSFCTQ
jgi:Nif-specific regulatory protein